MFEYNIAEIISYVLFCLVIIPLGVVICRKLYIDTKNEEHKEKGKVIQRIMKTYCVVQCGVWPLISAVFGLARFAKSSVFTYNHKNLMMVIISCLRSLIRLILGYVGFNSFVIASCRYVFIMHATHDEYTTVRKIRKFFIAMSIIAPITLWVLIEAFIAFPEVGPDIVGYQTHVESIIIAQSNLKNGDRTLNRTIDTLEERYFIIPQSPLFFIVKKYVSPSITSGLKIALYVIRFIILSNVPEGVLYTHIFIANNR